ncbi:hypothetical protein ACFLSZ_06070 [Candidatus Bipolaricaulota bacterium]
MEIVQAIGGVVALIGVPTMLTMLFYLQRKQLKQKQEEAALGHREIAIDLREKALRISELEANCVRLEEEKEALRRRTPEVASALQKEVEAYYVQKLSDSETLRASEIEGLEGRLETLRERIHELERAAEINSIIEAERLGYDYRYEIEHEKEKRKKAKSEGRAQ